MAILASRERERETDKQTEGRRDGGTEGRRNGGTEGRRDGGTEEARERGSEGGREGGREGEREGERTTHVTYAIPSCMRILRCLIGPVWTVHVTRSFAFRTVRGKTPVLSCPLQTIKSQVNQSTDQKVRIILQMSTQKQTNPVRKKTRYNCEKKKTRKNTCSSPVQLIFLLA